MPIKKAAFKDRRQTKKRTARNLSVKSSVRSAVKAARKAIGANDKPKATEAIARAIKKLDKAAQNKVLKRNTVSRLKSRLTKQRNKAK